MKKAEYLPFARAELDKLLAIIEAKNNDYTAGSDNAFANFEDTGGMVSPLVGVLLRMGDKMQRLRTYAKANSLAVAGESAADAARDMIGYSLIILGMLKDMEPRLNVAGPGDVVRAHTGPGRMSGVDEDVALIASLRAEQVKVDKPEFNLELKAGGRYKRRDGKVITLYPYRKGTDKTFEFVDGDSGLWGYLYRKELKGRHSHHPEADLIDYVGEGHVLKDYQK